MKKISTKNNKNHLEFNDIIKLEKASLTLRSKSGLLEVLKGIDFKVSKGDTISILGPSGAGKTSLLMIISGLEELSSGKLIFNNKNITNFNEDKLAEIRRDNIGIIFQSFRLIQTMTAFQNVCVPLELANMENINEKAFKALKDVGLKDRINHLPEQLSGGEQQRVAIARAIAPKPKLLLADEPTGNLDSKTGKIVIKELFKASKLIDASLVIVTHDKNIANKCQRKVYIEDGKIIKEVLKTRKRRKV